MGKFVGGAGFITGCAPKAAALSFTLVCKGSGGRRRGNKLEPIGGWGILGGGLSKPV